MNKRLVIVITVMLAGGIVLLLLHKKNDESDTSLLVVTSNYSMKYGATFGGTALFNDSFIYTWYYSSTKSKYNSYVGGYSINTRDGFKEFLMNEGKKKEEKVKREDLSRIKKIIKRIKVEDTKVNCELNENEYSEIIIYKDDEILKLKTSEKCDSYSSNENIAELLSIISKYKKK